MTQWTQFHYIQDECKDHKAPKEGDTDHNLIFSYFSHYFMFLFKLD